MNSLALCSKQNTSYCLLFYFTNTTTTFAPNIDLSHEQCQQPWIETTWLIIRNQWSWNSAVRTMPTCHVRQTVPTDYNMYDQYFHFKPLQTNKQRNKRAFSSNLCYPPPTTPSSTAGSSNHSWMLETTMKNLEVPMNSESSSSSSLSHPTPVSCATMAKSCFEVIFNYILELEKTKKNVDGSSCTLDFWSSLWLTDASITLLIYLQCYGLCVHLNIPGKLH